MSSDVDFPRVIAAALRPWLARHGGEALSDEVIDEGVSIALGASLAAADAYVLRQAEAHPAFRVEILRARGAARAEVTGQVRRLAREFINEQARREVVENEAAADFERSIE